jgi:hypothetical protein
MADSSSSVEIPLGVTVQGDVRIRVAHARTLIGRTGMAASTHLIALGTSQSTNMFQVAFHTGFVKDGAWTLEWFVV